MRLALALVFSVACSHAKTAPADVVPGVAVGATAPSVSLTTTSGKTIAFDEVLHGNAQTIVVFYRGFY
jgi:hypothetical protein